MFLSRPKWLSIGSVLFFAFFIVSTIFYFSSAARKPIRAIFARPARKILSIAVGPVLPGVKAKVVKVQTPAGLFIEVYGPVENGVAPLLQSIQLPDKQDALFQFQGRATDLALEDLNNDGLFEIIAPTYDASLVPHLNIYQYKKDAKLFAPYEK